MEPRRIVILTFPGVQPLDVVGPHEVFAGADRLLRYRGARGGYEVVVAATSPGPVVSESGLSLLATTDVSAVAGPIDTLVVPGGDGARRGEDDPALLAALRTAAASSRRLAGVCTGSFLLAAAGLLDGRTVTTHWARAGALAERHPDVTVDAEPIYVRDGDVWTSAGVTAGIDLSLALVEDDHGADVAQTVARWLVMFLRRPGGQSQFAAPVWQRPATRGPIRSVQDHIHVAPADDLSVPALARRAAMSERHFARVFAAETGEPPGRYVERVRVEHARGLLEQDGLPLTVVATRAGFGSAETLRRAFHRHLGVAPADYRRRFAVQ